MKLHVETTGSGPDLVLLHGWGLHSGAWDDVLPRLAASATVHTVDLPGHGHSAEFPAGPFDAAADAIAAVLPESCVLLTVLRGENEFVPPAQMHLRAGDVVVFLAEKNDSRLAHTLIKLAEYHDH